MDILSLATKSINIGDNVKQDDEDLRVDIDRLISIANDLVYMTDDFIYGVYVSPMNILQTKLSDIKDIKFHITYNATYVGEELQAKMELATNLVEEFCKGEFEGLSDVKHVEYHTSPYQEETSLVLFSIFDKVNINDLYVGTFIRLWNLVKDSKYTLSIPNSFPYEAMHSIIVHCKDYVDVTKTILDLKTAKEKYDIDMQQDDGKAVKIKSYGYIIVVGHKPIPYNIPYTYIDKNSFDNNRLTELGLNVIES